ncbi:MAG: hypothetical protein U0401_36670 [Anaerolineae bacterium]
MMRTVTVTLPEALYEQLEAQAQVAARSLDEVVVQTLARHLPPLVEDDLPLAIQTELKAMTHLADETLWQIAQGTMNHDKVAFYDLLLERHQNGTLTSEGRELLTRLREEAEALMLRKAHAYALLQSRGHQLPTLEELQAQAA